MFQCMGGQPGNSSLFLFGVISFLRENVCAKFIYLFKQKKQTSVLQTAQTLPSCGMHEVFVLKLMFFIVIVMVLAREQNKQRLVPGNSYLSTLLQSAQSFKAGQQRSIYVILHQEE